MPTCKVFLWSFDNRLYNQKMDGAWLLLDCPTSGTTTATSTTHTIHWMCDLCYYFALRIRINYIKLAAAAAEDERSELRVLQAIILHQKSHSSCHDEYSLYPVKYAMNCITFLTGYEELNNKTSPGFLLHLLLLYKFSFHHKLWYKKRKQKQTNDDVTEVSNQ